MLRVKHFRDEVTSGRITLKEKHIMDLLKVLKGVDSKFLVEIFGEIIEEALAFEWTPSNAHDWIDCVLGIFLKEGFKETEEEKDMRRKEREQEKEGKGKEKGQLEEKAEEDGEVHVASKYLNEMLIQHYFKQDQFHAQAKQQFVLRSNFERGGLGHMFIREVIKGHPDYDEYHNFNMVGSICFVICLTTEQNLLMFMLFIKFSCVSKRCASVE